MQTYLEAGTRIKVGGRKLRLLSRTLVQIKPVLPNEIWTEVFLRSDLPTINRLCQTNITFSQICHSDNLWRRKLRKDYPEITEKPEDVSWKEYYQELLVGTEIEIYRPVGDETGYLFMIKSIGNIIAIPYHTYEEIRKKIALLMGTFDFALEFIRAPLGYIPEGQTGRVGQIQMMNIPDAEVWKNIWDEIENNPQLLATKGVINPPLGKLVIKVDDEIYTTYYYSTNWQIFVAGIENKVYIHHSKYNIDSITISEPVLRFLPVNLQYQSRAVADIFLKDEDGRYPTIQLRVHYT